MNKVCECESSTHILTEYWHNSTLGNSSLQQLWTFLLTKAGQLYRPEGDMAHLSCFHSLEPWTCLDIIQRRCMWENVRVSRLRHYLTCSLVQKRNHFWLSPCLSTAWNCLYSQQTGGWSAQQHNTSMGNFYHAFWCCTGVVCRETRVINIIKQLNSTQL